MMELGNTRKGKEMKGKMGGEGSIEKGDHHLLRVRFDIA